MIFVFLHPKLQKSQEFLARRVFVCSKQETLRRVVSERLLEGKNRWDRIGRLRNEGLRARHPSDGATAHFDQFSPKVEVLKNWSDLKNVSVLEQVSCHTNCRPSSFTSEPGDRWIGTFPRQAAGSTLRGGKYCKVL